MYEDYIDGWNTLFWRINDIKTQWVCMALDGLFSAPCFNAAASGLTSVVTVGR